MNVNPTGVAKKASPLCGGKVCYPTQPYRIIVHSSHGIVNASCENYNSRLSICSLESDEIGMRDLLDVLIMRTNHQEKYVQQ